MSEESNITREAVRKADLALADISGDNGILKPAQAAQFMRQLIKESKLMGMATVTPLRAPEQIINKLRFSSRVLRRGYEGTALPEADRSKPSFSNVAHAAKLFKGEVRITDEVLEDNIEGERFRDTIMTLMSEAVARDIEELVVKGDTASSDTFLAAFDGIIKRASTNVVAAGGVPLSKTVLRDMLKTLPSEYLRDKGRMQFFTGVDAEIDYRDSLSDRMTIVGDRALAASGESSAPVGYSGIRVTDIPLFPENLGGGTNETVVILCDPKNIDIGMWRQIKVKTDEDISEGVLKIVVTMRLDALYQEEPAVVKATGVTVT